MAKQLTQEVAKVEVLAEEFLQQKHQIIAYDRRRNTNREALGELRRKGLSKSPKVWMNFGECFVKLPHAAAQSLIEKDQATLDAEIVSLRAGLQQKAQTLAEKGAGPEMSAGWNLKGMSQKEFSAPIVP